MQKQMDPGTATEETPDVNDTPEQTGEGNAELTGEGIGDLID